MRIACVTFSSGLGRVYDFFTDLELQEGDVVVCDTSKGYTLGTVVNLTAKSVTAHKWVVQKVDIEAHKVRLEREKQLNELKRRMVERRKRLEDEAVYKLLAKEDQVMADLLKQFEELKG